MDRIANVDVAKQSWKEALDTNNLAYLRNLIEEGIVVDVDYQPKAGSRWNYSTQKSEPTYKDQALIRVLDPEFASSKEQEKFAEILMKKYKANPDLRGSQYTPLEKAALTGRLEIVKKMINYITKLKKTTTSKVFSCAIKGGFDEIIEYLVEEEINTDKDDKGDTVLMFVLRSTDLNVWKKLDTIKMLLKSENVRKNINESYNHESAFGIANKKKMTSKNYYESKGWEKIVSVLTKAGAKM